MSARMLALRLEKAGCLCRFLSRGLRLGVNDWCGCGVWVLWGRTRCPWDEKHSVGQENVGCVFSFARTYGYVRLECSSTLSCEAKQSQPGATAQRKRLVQRADAGPSVTATTHHFPSLPLPPPLLPLYYIHTDTTFSSHHAPFPLTLFSNRPCATGPRDHPARRVPAKLRLEHRAVAAHRSTRTPNILSREDLFEIRLDAPALSYPRLEDGLWPVRVTT